MRTMHHINRKLILTLIFSLLVSVAAIIHGIFIDLDLSQLKRFTIEGFFLTFMIVFPSILLLEWIFDLNNKEEFKILEKKVSSLEKKLNKKS